MPIENNVFINTKAVLVKERQEALSLMYEEPWSVDQMSIDQDGEVMVKFNRGPSINVGRLKSKYRQFWAGNLQVLRWQITGGDPIPGYISERGQRLRTYGLNLRLLIVTEKEAKQEHGRGERIPQSA